MKHHVIIRPLIFVICFFYVSCSNKNILKVSNVNFGEEIETRQNLVFTFDREVVPDSLINLWDTIPYLKLSPDVKGSFKWISSKELVFSPSGEFLPATKYTATLEEPLLRFTSNLQFPENPTFTFRTAPLKTTGVSAWWSQDEVNAGMVNLNAAITFNYPIDPAVISRLLTLKINGTPARFRISGNEITNELQIITSPVSQQLTEGSKLEYIVLAGARCRSCTESTTQTLSGSLNVKPPGKLEITHVEGEPEAGGGFIRVYCNQPVNIANAEKLISISPKLNFTVESEGNGLLIKGNFEPGSSYQLEINQALTGVLGGSMDRDYTALVPFGNLEPSISFINNKGVYLSGKSSKKIGINIVNIQKVNVKIFKIYENNIMAFMKYHRYNDYYDEYGEGSHFGYNTHDMENIGDVIYQQEYETKNLGKHNDFHLLNLDISDRGAYQGIYFVSVASSDDQWRKASRVISISDIGLIARKSEDEVYVFANSISNAEAVKGARISFISTNNQELQTITTNSEGVAVLKGIKTRYSGFDVGMITARHHNDFNYMLFSDTRVENSRFDVGGKRDNPSGYQAFLYGDREIYRPGEKVFLNTVIRTANLQNLTDVPVKIRILMPNGREYMNIRKTLNSQGATEASFDLSPSSVTGTWSMEIYSSNDVLLTTRNFSVEEFIPDRISVSFSTDKDLYGAGDSILAELTAMNLFGTPASMRNYEMDFSLRRKTIDSKKFENYNFQISGSENITFSNILKEGKTDNSGKAKQYFPVASGQRNIGLLNGKIYVTVFDETGRPVNRVKSFDVSTQPVYYGIRLNEYYNNARQPMEIALASVDAKGLPVASAGVQVQVIRVLWETIMERTYGDRYRYVSQKKEIVLSDELRNIGKDGTTFKFTPNESGEYYIRVKNPSSGSYVQSDFYAYGYGYTQNSSFEVNNEGQVEISFDKETYEPGQKAKVLCRTPFAGRLLITIERNRVLEYFYLKTDKRSASFEIPVKEEYLPNVYVTATLFRPLDEGIIPVTIAHGFAPLHVFKNSNKIPVDLIVSPKSRSNTVQNITVRTGGGPGTEVTVAVVDEGIMQLKNSPSPDPYDYFYKKRALEVAPFDIYPYVLPDIRLKKSSSGGDGYDLQKRVNPMTSKRVKLVAYWSGILKTNSNGEATCKVNIPQFSGDLRVMAVAYKNQTFGSAENHIKVADPIVISPSMPRFLSPGDTLLLPVTITNTTASVQQVNVALEQKGPLKSVGEISFSKSIPAGSELRPVFTVASLKSTGEASVTIKADNGSEIFTDKTEISIRPPASLQKISGSGDIEANKSGEINLKNNFLPASVKSKLLVSNSPVVQFSDHLSYLLGYPYGCVEQTVSTAFPQLYFSSLVRALKEKPGRTIEASTNIQAAISKLQSMQQYNGAMSYWPGGNEESWWGSAYAAHFLNEASEAGYEVNKKTIESLMNYLSSKVKQHPVEAYYYYDENSREIKKTIPSKDIFYSLYLLALYSKADLATMNYYRPRMSELAMDSKYLLATSYLACGDRRSYVDLLPKVFEGEFSKKSTGGNFYSYIRDKALALNALLETDPDNPQTGQMVRDLSIQIKKEKYLSTQERAFAFLALGKFMNKSGGTVTSSIVSNGKQIGEFKGEDLIVSHGIGDNVIIKTNGTGRLYYFWEKEGITADGSFKEEDSKLMVRKTFLSRMGKPVSIQHLKQNELVVIKLTLINKEGSEVDNVVISDMLPAGFEIENPRISAVPELQWIKDNSVPDHMDIRDDRIHFFTSADHKPRSFYYLVRAVSTGKFIMGPVSADAMYDGSYHSIHGSGSVTITN